jgi:cytochrome c553
MNRNMAALTKGAVAVVVVAGIAVGSIAWLFRSFSHESRAPERAASDVSTPARAPAATPGAAGPGAAGTQPGAAPTASAPAQRAQAAPAATPPRKGTEFSFPPAQWDQLLAQGADPAAGEALANTGKAAAGVAACASCHGAQGMPAPGTPFPVLAGASAAYLAKQLLDYRNGNRQHPIMVGIAKNLSDQDIAAVARYYGGLPAPAIKPAAPNAQDRGQQLHTLGDNGLALAACANCHGAKGEGEPPMLPRLAGQPEAYLSGQLEAFRSGQRANDDLGTMREIAKRLSPDDAAALARYYAGMRPQ